MASLDIFNNDAFSLSALTETIVDIPRVPTIIGDMGLFGESGINSTTMMIERKGASLNLVPSAPRGGVGQGVTRDKRKMISVIAPHLPQADSVLADEVQGIRAFGSETEVEAVQTKVAERLGKMKANLDLTLEFHRVGAIKGQVLDADGSVLHDMYSIFGMTQTVVPWNIATVSAAGDVKQSSIDLKRAIQAALGGRSYKNALVLCSQGFFDDMVKHQSVAKAYSNFQNTNFFNTDQSEADFAFAGVTYRIYLGGTSAGDFIPDGEAYGLPIGVPGQFITRYAPADYMETVNTNGLPYYAKQELMRMNKGVDFEAQSNPINLNTLPETVFRLKASAS